MHGFLYYYYCDYFSLPACLSVTTTAECGFSLCYKGTVCVGNVMEELNVMCVYVVRGFSEGVIHYECPQGYWKKNPDVDLRDSSYDGWMDESGILQGGLGLLTDSVLGPSDFRVPHTNKGKKKSLKISIIIYHKLPLHYFNGKLLTTLRRSCYSAELHDLIAMRGHRPF